MVYTVRVSETTMQPTADRVSRSARCIVWCSAQARPPAPLLKALESRGLSLKLTVEPYTAVADVLLAARNDEVVVLVAIEPAGLKRFDEVLATLDRYVPRAARWTYSEHQTPPLQVARAAAAAHTSTEPKVTHAPRAQTSPAVQERPVEPVTTGRPGADGPMLRLAGLGVLREAANESMLQSRDDGMSDGLRGHSTLTNEEMEALLGSDSDDTAGSRS